MAQTTGVSETTSRNGIITRQISHDEAPCILSENNKMVNDIAMDTPASLKLLLSPGVQGGPVTERVVTDAEKQYGTESGRGTTGYHGQARGLPQGVSFTTPTCRRVAKQGSSGARYIGISLAGAFVDRYIASTRHSRWHKQQGFQKPRVVTV